MSAKRPVLVLRDADSGEVVSKMDLPISFYGRKIHLDIDVVTDDRISIIPVGFFGFHKGRDSFTNRTVHVAQISSAIAEAMNRDHFISVHWVEPTRDAHSG